jgi:hypothetical protein
MVIIPIPSGNFSLRTLEMSLEGNALGEDSLAPWYVRRRKTSRRLTAAKALNCGKGLIPVPMAIGVLSAHPADEIPVVEIKAEESTGMEEGSVHGQFAYGLRRGARQM